MRLTGLGFKVWGLGFRVLTPSKGYIRGYIGDYYREGLSFGM